jgi:protein tyrosine phosphatase (PTP) superfamily phosphohydrolase (DUF442 family)
MLRILVPFACTALLVPCVTAETNAPAAPPEARPAQWAQPLTIEGLPNLHVVVTGRLYRSAQPTAQGMQNIERLGVKTVVNLRAHHRDDDELAGTKLRGENIAIDTWALNESDVVRFLQIAATTNGQPVLVHCLHGADRTGTLCAVYRMAVQGWTREDALREMTEGGYGYHPLWKNLTRFLQDLDIESVRRKAGLAGTPVTARP